MKARLEVKNTPLPLYDRRIAEDVTASSTDYSPDGKLYLRPLSHIVVTPGGTNHYVVLGMNIWLSLETGQLIKAQVDQFTEVKKLTDWKALKITQLDKDEDVEFKQISQMWTVVQNANKGSSVYNLEQLVLFQALLDERIAKLRRLASLAIEIST